MRMKAYLSILIPLIVLLICIFIAALLGYGFFLLIEGKLDLDKIISKTALGLLLLSTFPARRWLKLSWLELGFKPWRELLREIGIGILIGIAVLLPILLCLYAMDILIVDETREQTVFYITKTLIVSLFLAALISFAEEPLFRGVLLTAYSRKLGIVFGIMVSSFYYASLHFTKTKKELAYEDASLSGAFDLVGDALLNVVNPANFSAWLSLLMVGIFLAVIRQQFQLGMGICIGCHTGWVVLIKMTKKFFNNDWSNELSWLISRYDGVIGPLVTAWLFSAIIMLIIYAVIYRKPA